MDGDNNYKPKTNSVFGTLGVNSSNHTTWDRATDDYYDTDPKAIDYLLEQESFSDNIWECAVGGGHLAKRLEEYGYNVTSTDIVYRGYGKPGIDFLKETDKFNGDIITNPPYKYAKEFALKGIELTNRKLAMFLKIQFLETKGRYNGLFDTFPPSHVYVFVKRIKCYKNGVKDNSSSAVCYCWFVWDKEYDGNTTVEWIDNE
jgi:hypothetical protein